MSQVNVELGRPQYQAIDMNNYDVRRLAGQSSGAVSMSNLHGKSNYIDQKVVTVGSTFVSSEYISYTLYGFGRNWFGSINSDTLNIQGGGMIQNIYWFSIYFLILEVKGNLTNSGFTTMNIDGHIFQRADASYGYSSGTNSTSWSWNNTSINPFGTTTGVQKTITWT